MQRLFFAPEGQDSLTLRVHSNLFVLWYFFLRREKILI